MTETHTLFRIACTLVAIVTTSGCASGRAASSYLPIGAGAQYGNSTNDGVAFTLPLDEADAISRIHSALARAGYTTDSVASRSRTIRTEWRTLSGDTTVRVAVQVTSLEPSATGSSVVVTGDYSSPSGKILNRPIIQRPGSINPLYQRLRELGSAIAREP